MQIRLLGFFFFSLSFSFLDATTHLYKRSCPSVGPSVGLSSVIFEGTLGASCAVYPALLDATTRFLFYKNLVYKNLSLDFWKNLRTN